MEPQEYQEYYESIQNDIEAVDVLTNAKEIAALYRRAAKKLDEISDYKDSAELAREYRKKADRTIKEGKESLYKQACERMNNAQSVVERKLAVNMFQSIRGYKDADELRKVCEHKNLRDLRLQDIRNCLIIAAIAVVVVLFIYYA